MKRTLSLLLSLMLVCLLAPAALADATIAAHAIRVIIAQTNTARSAAMTAPRMMKRRCSGLLTECRDSSE